MKTPTQALALSAKVSKEIATRSAHCGIPAGELADMMAKAGLEQYDGDGITVRPASERDTIHVTHGFTASQWQRIERKAKAQGCDARAMLDYAAEMLGSTEDLVPLWLPERIVNRLAVAGEAADIEDPCDGIAEAVLGDMLADPGMLLDLVRGQWPDVPESRLAALERLCQQWQAEDASAKGGAA